MEYIKILLTTIISIFLYKFDSLLLLFFVLILADYFTGILIAIKNKTLSSKIALWGFINKLIMIGLIAICFRLDCLLNTNITIRNVSIIWFSIGEGISVLENSCGLGVNIPDGILEILLQYKNKTAINVKNIIKNIGGK